MKLTVQLGENSYDIVVAQGALGRVGRLTGLGGRVLVVHDTGVPEQYIKTVAGQCGTPHVLALPAGDTAKTEQAALAVVRALYQNGFCAGDTLVALGGGAVCDIAGFAAALYRPGPVLCKLPTTLTAQASAAASGTCYLNCQGARDLLALRRQPALVVADPDALKTLPTAELASGLGSVMMLALVGSSELLAILEQAPESPDLEKLVCLCLLYKKGLAEHDEDGHGQQRLLRFGQPFANALLQTAPPGALTYGQALVLGMLRMVGSRTLAARLRRLATRLGIGLKYRPDAEQLAACLLQSPQRREDSLLAARVKMPGNGYLEMVPAEELALLAREGGTL